MKLAGYNKVAITQHNSMNPNKKYAFALYDKNNSFSVGDKVIVSGTTYGQILTIKEIYTLDQYMSLDMNDPTQEVIARVDTSAYDHRVAQREKAEQIKKEMDKLITKLDQEAKYQMYAGISPEFADLLHKYQELTEV